MAPVKSESNAHVYSAGRTSARRGLSRLVTAASPFTGEGKGVRHRLGSARKRVSISRYSAGGLQEENFARYANERHHLQPLQHSTCFNYTFISSINTPHSGRAAVITPRCYPGLIMRRRRSPSHPGERLKNATAPTELCSHGRSGRSQRNSGGCQILSTEETVDVTA